MGPDTGTSGILKEIFTSIPFRREVSHRAVETNQVLGACPPQRTRQKLRVALICSQSLQSLKQEVTGLNFFVGRSLQGIWDPPWPHGPCNLMILKSQPCVAAQPLIVSILVIASDPLGATRSFPFRGNGSHIERPRQVNQTHVQVLDARPLQPRRAKA